MNNMLKNLVIWLVIGLVLMTVFNQFSQRQDSRAIPMEYSEFMEAAKQGQITKVEIQVDDGPWQPAELAGDASVDTWRQWKYTWKATPGTHTVQSRATDGTGTVQTAQVRDVLPNGATGYDSRSIVVG